MRLPMGYLGLGLAIALGLVAGSLLPSLLTPIFLRYFLFEKTLEGVDLPLEAPKVDMTEVVPMAPAASSLEGVALPLGAPK